MKSGFLLNVVICEGSAILKLFASKNEPLLIRRNSLFVLDICLHVVNDILALHLKSYGLSGQRFYEYLHFFMITNATLA